MMLRLDKHGRPYQSLEYGLHGQDVKREISMVQDHRGAGLQSVESLMKDEAINRSEMIGRAKMYKKYYEEQMKKAVKEKMKNAFLRDRIHKEQMKVKKTLSGSELAALEYMETSKRPNTYLPNTRGASSSLNGANFSNQDVVNSGINTLDPRQPHTDFDKIMGGEFIGQPIGTPVVGYDHVSQGSRSTPQMAGFFSDMFESIGLKEEYQSVRDSIKSDVKENTEVYISQGVEYIKDASGNLINKATGQIAPQNVSQNMPASFVNVPGIGSVDKTWLYVGAGVLSLGVILIIMRRR